ncbi:MAG: hypothetical protein ACTHLB_05510 [Parafilimonas sp.]
MNTIVTNEGGFDKVIFESVLDTYAGGVTIDPTGNGYTNADGIIPAGSIVSKPNATTGLATILPPSTTGSDFNNAIGLVYQTVKLDANPFVSVVIDGTARQAALGWSDAQTAAIAPKLKKLIIV